jgi:hypothetical protein
MTTHNTDAKDLISLAGRMSIPVDEAMRQVAQLIADIAPPGEDSDDARPSANVQPVTVSLV